MNKVFINIKNEDFIEAFKNLNVIYNCGHQGSTIIGDDLLYIRIYSDGSKIFHGWGDMEFMELHKNDTFSLFKGYESIDYYEWYKENEVILTAKKFGLY